MEKSKWEMFNELSPEKRQEIIDDRIYNGVKRAQQRNKKKKKDNYQFIIWNNSFEMLWKIFYNLYKFEYIEQPEHPTGFFIPYFHFRDKDNNLFNLSEYKLPTEFIYDVKENEKKIIEYFENNPAIKWKKSQTTLIEFIIKLHKKNLVKPNLKPYNWELFCNHFESGKMDSSNVRSIISQNRITEKIKNEMEENIFYNIKL